MQTIDFSIDIPQNKSIDVAMLKQKVMEFAVRLINVAPAAKVERQDEDMVRAMQFIDSLAVPGGENIPVKEDGVDALVEQKY